MFLGWYPLTLAAQLAKRADDLRSRLPRVDNRVDESSLGGDEGVGEFLSVLFHLLLPDLRRSITGLIQFSLVEDVDGALGTHDGDLRRREGEVDVGADVLAGHDAVRAAVGLAGDDGDLRNRRLGEGVEQLRAVLDDAAELLLGSREGSRARPRT